MKHFRKLFANRNPDIYFKIFQGDKIIRNTEKEVLWQINGNQKELEIIIDMDEESKRTLEYIIDAIIVKNQVEGVVSNLSK